MDHPLVKSIQRLFLLGVPLDVVPDDAIVDIARQFAEQDGHKAIVFLTYTKFMHARRDPDFLAQLKRAALVIPVSMSLVRACRFLKMPTLKRHFPFDFAIRFLGALEEKRRSFYLLGEHHSTVQSIANNMRTSFPRLLLVGRHAGYYGRDKEEAILSAIQKATPTILLLGSGVPGHEKWAFRQGRDLPVRISLYSETTFQIMGGRKKRPAKTSVQKGTHELPRAITRPWRLLRIFSYLGFGFLLLLARFKKNA